MIKNELDHTNEAHWITHKEHEERRDMHKEHEKETLIQGIFMGIMIGSFFMAIMIHFLENL